MKRALLARFALGMMVSLTLLHAPCAGATENATYDMAVMGDSLSTGAGTHPGLKYDARNLWDIFDDHLQVPTAAADIPGADKFGLSDPLAPPGRAWPTSREFEGGFNWVFHTTVVALSRAYLDTEEYSWGYLVASRLGIPPARLLLAAENGHRTAQMPRQVDRILVENGGTMPGKVFVFFTGNDLCGQAMNFVTSVEDYEDHLWRSLEYLLRNSNFPAGGTDVYLPAFVGVLQLVGSKDILAKKVFAHGEQISCKTLRERMYRPKPDYDPKLPPEAGVFALMMPPNPAAFCPTLFGRLPGRDPEALVGELANRIRKYREKQQAVVGIANRYAKERKLPVRFHYIPDTGALTFKGEDVAQDCFHLSTLGQVRLADAVLSHLEGGSDGQTGH